MGATVEIRSEGGSHPVSSEDHGRALIERAREVAGRLNSAHRDLVALAAEVIADPESMGRGFTSAEHWLTVRAGISPARARDAVRIARRAGEQPVLTRSRELGRITFDQAAVVASRVPSSHEESITHLAEQTTVTQLRRVVARYDFAAGQEAAELALARDGGDESSIRPAADTAADADVSADPPVEPPCLAMWHQGGRFHLRYEAPSDVGALIEHAVREAKDALFTSGQTSVTHADAIAEMSSRSLSSTDCSSRAARYRVYVHLSADGSWLNGRGSIPRRIAERFTCDGIIQPVHEDRHGRPVSVGREQRIVPMRTRRLIEDRDRGCVVPGCPAVRFVEIHHVDFWSRGGGTDYESNVSLCPAHHDALHRGEIAITIGPDGIGPAGTGLTVTDEHGMAIASAPTGMDEAIEDREAGRWRAPTGERLHLAGLSSRTELAAGRSQWGDHAILGAAWVTDGPGAASPTLTGQLYSPPRHRQIEATPVAEYPDPDPPPRESYELVPFLSW